MAYRAATNNANIVGHWQRPSALGAITNSLLFDAKGHLQHPLDFLEVLNDMSYC